uniref:Uncharacterized protein n=1 Tax=Panagrolaimus sp. JU765 TaxID=591449 RepID=A0AC34R571_9BILA
MYSPKRSKSPTYSVIIPSSNESSPEKSMYRRYPPEYDRKPSTFALSNGTTTSECSIQHDNDTTLNALSEVEVLKQRISELEASNSRAIMQIALLKEQMANVCTKMELQPLVINIDASVREELLKGKQTVIINIKL